MKKLLNLVLSFAALGVFSTASQADPIGGPGSGCITCADATYTLFSDYVDTNADPLFETYRVSLLIDTSTLTNDGFFIDAVAIKIGSSITGASLFSFPGDSSAWQVSVNSVLSGPQGCNANGGGGFACAETGDPAQTGGTLEWIFDITLAAGDLIDPASIKVRYLDVTGGFEGQVSENIELQTSPCVPGTPGCRPPFLVVPEPSSLALLGLAVFAAGAVSRRRKIG